MSDSVSATEELCRALFDLVECIQDSDMRPPGEVTAMRMVSIVSDKKTHAAIDRARMALARAANEFNRCSRCDWPLVADPKDGCTVGNCSMRGDLK